MKIIKVTGCHDCPEIESIPGYGNHEIDGTKSTWAWINKCDLLEEDVTKYVSNAISSKVQYAPLLPDNCPLEDA